MELKQVLQENIRLKHLHVQCCYFDIHTKRCVYFDKPVNPNSIGCEVWNTCNKCIRRSYVEEA